MKEPLVSIIIPVYNGSNYVAEAIESAVTQKYKNLEILVINDGSKDDGKTKEAVEPFLKDKRVRYIEKENGGSSSALNLGIKEMKGEFFSWLSHDDTIEESSVSARIKKWFKLGADPKTIISTQTTYIGAQGDRIFRLAPKSKDVNNIYDIISSTVNGCSLLIHRSLLENRKFQEGMIFMQDYFLWADLITNENAKIRVINRKLTNNRVHDGQITTNRYDLLVRDFGIFATTYIDPLIKKKDFKQIKDICFTLAAHLSTRPFYKGYLDKYLAFLKSNNEWKHKDELKLKEEFFISWGVGKTRHHLVMAEPNNKVEKVIFVTNLAFFHQTGLWDEFVKGHPEVNFTYLCTGEFEQDRIDQHYKEDERKYLVKSRDLSDEELSNIFDNVDIVVYGYCLDPRVEKYITNAKHLVVESEHLSGRYHRGLIGDILARWKFFNVDHKNWKKMNKSLFALSYYAYDDYKHFGFKNSTYRFGYFPELEYKKEEVDPYKLLWFGRNIDVKRVQDTIYALLQFRKKDKRYTLDIVGEGPRDKKIRKLVKKHHLEDAVNFYPFEDHDSIVNRIRRAGIGFFTSNRGEGWGVALNEMLSQKQIVFTNINAGGPMYLANKHNAFIYKNRRELKKKIRLYFEMDEKQLDEVRENAGATISEKWNNKIAASRMFEFFNSIIKKERQFDKYKDGPVSKHVNKKRKLISDETNLAKIEKKSRKNIALGSIFGYLTVALAILSGLVLTPWIINVVGEGSYGVYGLATSLIALFLMDFGLSTTTNTYLARLRAKNDKNGVEKFLATIFKFYLLLDLAFIIIIVTLYFLIDYIYVGYTYEQRELLKPVLLIVGSYSIVSFPSTCFTGVISTYEKFGWNKFVDFLNKLLYFLFTVVAIKLDWGVIGLVTVNAIAGIITIVMRYFFMRYYLGIRIRLKARVNRATIREIFKFSSWALVLAISARLVFNITPSILGIVADAEQGAIFGVITTIEGYIYTIGTLMSTFFMAKIARNGREKASDRRRHLQELAEKVGKLQFILISLIVLGFAVVGQEFITFWMKRTDTFAQYIYWGILALCISELVNIPETVFETAMYAEGHIKPLAINFIIKALVNVALSFWLSSLYGALGACIAIACARIITVILNNIVYRKYLDISLVRFFGKIYIRGLLAGGAAFGVGITLHYLMPYWIHDYKQLIIINGSIFVVAFIICTFVITLNSKERAEYGEFIRNLFGRKKITNNYDPNKKLNVLQVVGSMNGGGVESFVMTYFRELHNQMNFIFVVFDDSKKIPYDEINELGGKVIVVPHVKHLLRFNKAFKKVLKSEKYDIVHSHINTLSVFPMRVALKCGYKVRIAHSHSASNKKEFKRNLAKSLLKLFSKTYANVYMSCSEVAGRYQFGNSAYDFNEVINVPNAIDLDKFKFNSEDRNVIRNELGISSNDILVGNFGRMVDTKNQKYILNMAKITLLSNPQVKYLIIGSGDLEDELKKIKKDNKLDNVYFLENRSDINRFYSALDVLVLPSLYEGLGLAAIEAEANGLYCVLSEFVPKTTLVSKYGAYLPIDDKHINMWVSEISTYHDRIDAKQELAEAGYDVHESAKQMKSLYEMEVKTH